MITIQILTKNNEKTIVTTLESLRSINANIIIGDYGSTDGTLEICKKFNVKVKKINSNISRNVARSQLSSDSLNLFIEPWEIIKSDLSSIKLESNQGYVGVIKNGTITWEIRLWKGIQLFKNIVFEQLEPKSPEKTSIILFSNNDSDMNEMLEKVEKWIIENPFDKSPYYYKSCILLSQGKYKEFIRVADHYLLLDKNQSMSSVMTRYYYAVVQLTQNKLVKPTLQNLNLCLCVKPLMAEFWCLTGDVYYHLLNKYRTAKEFYENALFMGSRRLSTDVYPMNISKYNHYPKLMIKSCNELIEAYEDQDS